MKRHATTLLRRGASVAGYGEIASASASIKAHMLPHGYVAGLDLVVVYEFRGPEASKVAYEEEREDDREAQRIALDALDALLGRPPKKIVPQDTVGCGRAHLGPAPAHTWWPRQPHLCTTLSSLYTVTGLDFLSGLDDLNTARVAVPGSAPHVADDLYGHIHRQVALRHTADSTWAYEGNPAGDWGALPVVVFARAWPIAGSYEGAHWGFNDNPNYRSRLPRFPWLASRHRARRIDGLPDPDDSEAIGAFHALASHRDDALKSAITRGYHPYSYDGMRIMFQSLRRTEEYASSESAAVISGLKDMRRQLYANPYRV
ncbi:hypothetical protein pqer_cds_677 [Pandoravirus quercus]|uniref:Uncharacterized protein n=1 Tax=Pandoravirus quercus TaxID=2107709 RepID=A0A2U7U9J0_9VIRU|nr:hypothetical protein pqer_cds_677 [Pandoravirus quercus]AVK75099.1 hypothetical protein pqer_cds_677 [Pandoravirus quercus]